jgi:hypothetical protein
MTTAISSYGTLFRRDSGAGFAAVGEVTNMGIPGLGHPWIQSTHHESPGGFREFIASKIREVKQFTITVSYVPSAAGLNATTGIIKAWNDGTVDDYKVIFPDTSEWAFEAGVSDFDPEDAPGEGEEKLSAVITFRPTGQPTLV